MPHFMVYFTHFSSNGRVRQLLPASAPPKRALFTPSCYCSVILCVLPEAAVSVQLKMRCRSSTDYFTKLLQELKRKYQFDIYLSQAQSALQLNTAALCSDMNPLTNCSKRKWVSTSGFAQKKSNIFLKVHIEL